MTSFKSIYTVKKLTEGVIPPHISMPLDQIISDGNVTNNAQIFLLASLTNLFKVHDVHTWNHELNSYEAATGADDIEAIKKLSPHEHVELAKWLNLRLKTAAEYWEKPACDSNKLEDWIRLVLRKNDD